MTTVQKNKQEDSIHTCDYWAEHAQKQMRSAGSRPRLTMLDLSRAPEKDAVGAKKVPPSYDHGFVSR